jgi:Mrp family chromosome partitioning ATPase/capsular polysaccharide biosynthesis protein
MTLHDYLRILKRRKWIVIVPVVLAPVVALLVASGGSSLYEASAQVLVNRQNLSSNLTGVNDPTQNDSLRFLTTQAQFARLPVVAQAALREVGLKHQSASYLLGESRVTTTNNSDFLTFTVSDLSRTRAIALANAYAHQYAQYARQYETAQFAAAARAIRGRMHNLQRGSKTASSLSASLAEKLDELTAMQAFAATSKQLERPATGAGRAASHTQRNVFLALVLALITGLGLAFLRDALDTRLRSGEEIGSRLELPLLARLPRPPRALRRANRLVMLDDPDSPHAEPFRMLRGSLEFKIGREPGERRPANAPVPLRSSPRRGYRMMITSAVEGEGKSTTVANLAVAFARAGRSVLVVDLDFRKASLHRFFRVSAKPGLTDVLLGSAQLSAAVTEVPFTAGQRIERSIGRLSPGALRLLPLGTLPTHAIDTSFAIGIEHVLAEIADETEIVLIDAPPLLRVGDALALTSHVDGLLVVASLRTVHAPMVEELRRILDAAPVTKLGFILTGADLEGGYEYLADRYHHVTLKAG